MSRETVHVGPEEKGIWFSRDAFNDFGNNHLGHELLTREEEADLTKRYQASLVAREMLEANLQNLDEEETERLTQIIQSGDESFDRLIECNLRLVASTAKNYYSRSLEFNEIFQMGIEGLIKSVEKFDHSKGYKFSTYATWWIRQTIGRGIGREKDAIRLPDNVRRRVGAMRKAERALEAKGKSLTDEALAKEMDISIGELEDLRSAAIRLVSLNMPVGEEGGAELGDLLPEEGSDHSEDISRDYGYSEVLDFLFESAKLSQTEKVILEKRFGINGYRRIHTAVEIAEREGLSRSRVGQLEQRALRKLRNTLNRSQPDTEHWDLANLPAVLHD